MPHDYSQRNKFDKHVHTACDKMYDDQRPLQWLGSMAQDQGLKHKTKDKAKAFKAKAKKFGIKARAKAKA